MTALRILNVEPENYCTKAHDILLGLGELVERPLDRAGLLQSIAEYDVLIVRLHHRIDKEVLKAGTRLKAVVSATTGLDHIDTQFAQAQGITVLSLQGEFEFLQSITATAEHTWALLLSLVRRIPWAFNATCAGGWNRDAFRGNQLSEKTLGVVGYGRVGRQVARYALAFNMRVILFDPYQKEIPATLKRCETLGELLECSDIVSLHVPLNAETAGMIGPAEFAAMPPKALLLNTARGAIVQEEALLKALQAGQIAGAAVDVLMDENAHPPDAENPLIQYALSHDNLIITPHIAGATVESMANTEVFMAQKLKRFLTTAPASLA